MEGKKTKQRDVEKQNRKKTTKTNAEIWHLVG